jgi:hypothetical protein
MLAVLLRKQEENKISNVIYHECGKYHYGDMSVIRPCCGKEVINMKIIGPS